MSIRRRIFPIKDYVIRAIYRTIFLKLVDFDVRLKSDISGGKLMRMYANDKEQNQLFILLFIDVLPLFQFDTRRGAH